MLVRLTLIMFAMFFLDISMCGQKISNGEDVWQYWYPNSEEEEPVEWEAQWIWVKEESQSDILLARRTFELDAVPEKAMLRISASSIYQLYINGKYVLRGPARSAPHHQSYDVLNVSSFLKNGENIIAIRAHHQKGKISYHFQDRAGLLVQLDLLNAMIISDDQWKVSIDPAWDNEAPRINRFQMVVNDRMDLRKKIEGWNEISYDDSEWDDAAPLFRNMGWPKPAVNAKAQTLTPPWTNLLPRDLPYLEESELQAAMIIHKEEFGVSYSRIDSNLIKSFLLKDFHEKSKGNNTPKLMKQAKIGFVLYDLGMAVNGMPKLEIEGIAGTKVSILTAPFIVNEEFSHRVLVSDFRDEIILSGGIDEWEAIYFKPCRYLGIIIEGGFENAKINFAGIHRISYPFVQKGNIMSADEPWISNYMDASAKTIDACTTDAYTDNYRERRQYAQTGYYAGLGNYYTFADHALQRRYLIQTAQEQEANGIMPAYAPLGDDVYMVILDSNCLWIRSLKNYLLYSGDYETTTELLPSAIKLMELLGSFTNKDGLIDNPPYAYWLDHSVIDRRGANFTLNAHYLGALEDFSEILNWLRKSKGNDYRAKADLLRTSLQNQFWSEEQQFFVDAIIEGIQSDNITEHANGLALALNIANADQANAISQKLIEKDPNQYIVRSNGMTIVTPAMSYFLHKGLCEQGYGKESFDLFRNRFDLMLDPLTNGTLWEEWWLDGTGRSGKLQKTSRSDAQTESAFPPALFAEYLLGFQVIKPGFKEVELSLVQSYVSNLEAVIPSPEGELLIKWDLKGEEGLLRLTIPGEIKMNLIIEEMAKYSINPILVNGKTLGENGFGPSPVLLSQGTYEISF